MIDIIKRLGKHSLIYGVGNMAVLLPGLILVPIYTRCLTPEEYGVLSIVTIFIGMLFFIYDLGMVGSLTRQYYEYDGTRERRRVVSTAFVFLLLWASVLTAIFMAFSPQVSKVMLKSEGFRHIFNVSMLSVFFSSLIFVPQTVLRLEERSWLFVALSTVRVVLTVIFTVLCLLSLHQGLAGVFNAMLLSALASALIYLAFTYKHIKLFDLSSVDLTEMLRFGIAFFPAIFFGWVIDYVNRYILTVFVSMGQVGIYSLGYKISQAIMIIVKAFYLAWVPIMFSIAAKQDARCIFSRIFTYFLFVLLLLVLALSLYSKEIILMLSNAQYADASKVLPIIALSGIGYGVYIYFMTGLSVVKKILNQPFILAFGAIFNVVLSIVLIKRMGMIGAAFATLLTYIVVAAMTYAFAQKYYRIDYEFARLFKLVGSFAVVFGIGGPVKTLAGQAGAWMINPLLLVMLIGLLYILRFFRKEEIEWLRKRMA